MTGKDGGPIEVEQQPMSDLEKAAAYWLAMAGKTPGEGRS
jgi:hypothetical protein